MTALYESQRLQFGLWRFQDLPLAQRLWTNRQTCRYIAASGAMTPRQAEQRMEREIQQYLQTGLQYHPLYRKEDGAFIGVCGLRPYQAKDPARQGQTICELGVHLLPDYWHAGYAFEAARRTMDRAFDQLSCHALITLKTPPPEACCSNWAFVMTTTNFTRPPAYTTPPIFSIHKKKPSELLASTACFIRLQRLFPHDSRVIGAV